VTETPPEEQFFTVERHAEGRAVEIVAAGGKAWVEPVTGSDHHDDHAVFGYRLRYFEPEAAALREIIEGYIRAKGFRPIEDDGDGGIHDLWTHDNWKDWWRKIDGSGTYDREQTFDQTVQSVLYAESVGKDASEA